MSRTTISKEKKEKLKNKINDSLDLKEEKPLEKFIETIVGIDRYYAKFLSQNILEEFDEWIISCLKKELNNAYNNSLIPKKSEIIKIISCVFFFSDKFKLFKQRELKKISAYCNRKKDKNSETAKTSPKDLVKKKKKEYQKLESEGFELLVNTPGVFIGKTKRGIVVKKNGVKCSDSPLINLKNISVLSRGVSLSSNVIEYCSEKNIPINFFDFSGKPYAKIYSFEPESASLGLSQLKAFENGKANYLARVFVSGKIRNQVNLVKYYSKYRKGRDEDFMEILNENIDLMDKLADEAKNIKEKDIEVLRGKLLSIEGRAASCYWELIEKMLNDYIDFEGRIRKGAKDIVNCALNYGYGILYSRIWEVVISTGLNPNISYLHKSQDNNKPSLIYDLIEQFRQMVVDKAVFSIITKNEELKMENEFLDVKTRKRVAEKVLEKLNNIEIYKGKETRFFQIIKEQVKDLADFFEDKSTAYHPFIGKW